MARTSVLKPTPINNLRNTIINGSFEFWQRNTSFVSPVNGSYVADRWTYIKEGTSTHTISRSTDIPSTSLSTYSILADCTTAEASIAAGSRVSIRHKIEGNFFKPLKGKKAVLAFWVKATKTGINCVSFWNNVQNKYLIKEYTVNAANTWERKFIRFQHDDSGTWSYDIAVGLDIQFTLAVGTTYGNGTVDVWSTGNKHATSNQVNNCDSTANNFQLSDVVLVEDNLAQNYEPDFILAADDIASELQLCQRYYEKSYEIGTFPGTVTNNGVVRWSNTASTVSASNSVSYKVRKRIQATAVTIYSTSGAANFFRNTTDSTDVAITFSSYGDNGFAVDSTAVGTANKIYQFHWISETEL